MQAVEFFGLSEKGLRERNEDAFVAADLGGIHVFAVAEGMGGPRGTRTAAAVAVEALGKGEVARDKPLAGILEDLLGNAERALYTFESENPGVEPSAVAMAVAVLSADGRCVVSSPGPRKVFFLAEGDPGQAGDAGDGGQGRFVVHDPGAGMHEAELPPGYLVFCSDGITDFLSDARIQAIIAERGGDLEGACRKIVAEAFNNGSDDNLTVVLVRRHGAR
ncbi:MAG: SpoIIE family protein phosphatase [Methanolinea sp.]|nr:SpoIIE family protein phosphatase [Methanolinea sp.]